MAHVWKGGNMYIWTIFIIYVPAPDAAALLIIQPASYFQVCCWSEKDANLAFGEFSLLKSCEKRKHIFFVLSFKYRGLKLQIGFVILLGVCLLLN